MSTLYRYPLPVEETHWKVGGEVETSFTWDYDSRSEDHGNWQQLMAGRALNPACARASPAPRP